MKQKTCQIKKKVKYIGVAQTVLGHAYKKRWQCYCTILLHATYYFTLLIIKGELFIS